MVRMPLVRTAAVVATAAALLLTATPGVATAATPAVPALVSCRYVFAAWPGGFTANLVIANNGPAITNWTVQWSVDTPTTNIVAWQADMSRSTALRISATNTPYNAVIPAGRVVAFGWNAKAVTTGLPSDLTVNGVRC